ncbi:hypothetical protein DE146DRAFT_254437 [Phaeosphaeria sp. MPI-PUGE-AT-0046c]|nr:hypothetical protein DE146DRAFT_254437 [Phaeosphaeria sp. MPI-PUGE-AT-0046c]
MRALSFLALASSAVAQQIVSPFEPLAEQVAPLPAHHLTKRQYDESCANVRSQWLNAKAQPAGNRTTSQIRIPAQIAYECLMSVPVDVEGDLKMIQELKQFLEYQSTLAWLKSGVEGQIKPLDIMAELDTISKNVKAKAYKSDYEVQLAIRQLLSSAGDFHLAFLADITEIFIFARPNASLVSISEDGIKLPELYLKSDADQLRRPNPPTNLAALRKINGQSTSEYLEQLSSNTSYHDADARYNNIFSNSVNIGLGLDTGGIFALNSAYPGPNTTLTFANGTVRQIQNVAVIPSIYNFDNVTSGKSFFSTFCQGRLDLLPTVSNTIKSRSPVSAKASLNPSIPSPSFTATPASRATPAPKALPSLIGYPKPAFIDNARMASGYYVEDQKYSDVAVLVVPSFMPETTKNGTMDKGFLNVQTTVRNFLADAVKQNKKKLIIDLRKNSGGFIDVGFELFKQLFPTVEPYAASRYRAHDAFHFFSAAQQDLAANGTNKDGKADETDLDDADNGLQSPYFWANVLDENRQPYKSYKDYYGPEIVHGDTFTSVRRQNFSNNEGGHISSVSLTGYNELKNITTQPFAADNIVIIQDGLCGSTCAIFAELMREQGKVQTIAVGGRPVNGPMQGIGGSKGVHLLGMDLVYLSAQSTLQIAYELHGAEVARYLNSTAIGKIANTDQLFIRSAYAPGRGLAGGMNGLNNQRMGDESQTPLEFIYEAADCRLFYTLNTLYDPVNLWKAAADVRWGQGKCVPQSTGHSTAIGVVESKKASGRSENLASMTTGVSSVAVWAAAIFAVFMATVM